MLKILSQEKAARRCEFPTVHGVIQTPAFMNVATCGAIKGAVSAYDLKELHCQVQLCNTYHLHVRPGDGLVKDLLILSRLSLSNVLLTKEFNDMNEIINKAIQSFKKQINEKGLKLVCDYQYQSPIRCDAMKMSQVIINLLSNAIKYSDQGTIRIQTYRENNFFVCTVADEGQGIAKENLDKIFHRFYRVDDARTCADR